MSKCNTRLYTGCCPSATPVAEDKPEVKPLPTPVPPKSCCYTFKVENITVVGEEVFVILDDCTFLKAPKSVLDKSVSECKDNETKATVEALQKALDALKPKVEALEAKEDKDTVYDPSVLEARVTALENASGTGSTNLTTLEARVSALESKEDKDTIFDPSSLIGRISALEGKEDKDTVYDDTAIRNLITALQNKEDKDTVFDPSALEARITALEGKEDKDTVYDDSALAARVKALEDTPAGDKVDTTAFVRKADLVDIQNFEGNVMFRAFPTTEAPVESTAETEAQPVVPAPAENEPQ